MANDGSGVIAQDGPVLVKVSEELESKAASLDRLREEFYSKIHENLGPSSDTQKMWYGFRAAAASREADKHKQTFEDVSKSIRELSEKIYSDATTWGTVDRANG